jgi:large subunit ribosomal protein L21
MYAVIESGGKQYRVQQGDVLEVEVRPTEAVEGSAKGKGRTKQAGERPQRSVTFDRVLMVGGGKDVMVGAPLVEGATVKATVLADAKGPKVLVFKKKRRKGYRRTKGHRQSLLRLRIEGIDGIGEAGRS